MKFCFRRPCYGPQNFTALSRITYIWYFWAAKASPNFGRQRMFHIDGVVGNKLSPHFHRLSSLPKPHVDRSSSEMLRPLLLIYWATSRVQVGTFVAKQRVFQQRPSIAGNRPQTWHVLSQTGNNEAYQCCIYIGLAPKC